VTFAVQLDDAGKRYRKYIDNPLMVNATSRLRRHQRRSEVWAVRHVDLTVEPGECVGVIGQNGSGKSTMLQLLAGVSAPSEGRVTVRGRVAPLLAVGVGFHAELTGRENIYLNATILGLTRRQIDAALDEIIAFSEIEPFIDTPVKFYSSGMSVRLGFSVAVQLTPDVLLLDEVLAVGDMAFQMKAYDRMSELIGSGATVLLVSHNMTAVRLICSRTMVLHHGDVRYLGPTDDAVQEYQRALAEEPPPTSGVRDATGKAPPIPDVAQIVDVRVESRGADAGATTITVVADVERPWPSAGLAIVLTTKAGLPVYYEASSELGALEPGRWSWSVDLHTPLAGGEYALTVVLRSLEPLGRFDIMGPVPLIVEASRGVSGAVDLGGSLRVHTGVREA
jgi:ABC-type polysaccharide/polyol phosphate transport system ATPase subunit